MFHISSVIAQLASRAYLASERAAEDYCDEVVDGEGRLLYVDKVGSVSGAIEIENDCEYVPDHNKLFL